MTRSVTPVATGGLRPQVVVVGLGPAGVDLLTAQTQVALRSPGPVFLRTRRHPAAEAFPDLASFDHLYDEYATFDEVYRAIVEALVTAAWPGSREGEGLPAHDGLVVYGVPGSPMVAERTVELLLADPRVQVTVEPALSFVELAWARLGIDPMAEGARLVDGTRFAEEAAGDRGPMLVGQCWSTDVLSRVKLALELDGGLLDGGRWASDQGASDQGVRDRGVGERSPRPTLLHHLGLDDEVVRQVAWEELDRAIVPDHLTALWIPELRVPVAGEMARLEELTRTLRSSCPWDREQTHSSLTRHLLEESYEVIDAVDALSRAERDGTDETGAVDHLAEELGDLLFQVFLHSRLAAEEGRFTLAEVAQGVHDKLVFRHPHVFGDVTAETPGAVAANWELLKQQEKGRASVTDGVPSALPALALAAKLLRKGRAIGLNGLDDYELAQRLAGSVARLGSVSGSPAAAEETRRMLAAALLDLTDLAQRLGEDPESVLREAATELRARIVAAEDRAAEDGAAEGRAAEDGAAEGRAAEDRAPNDQAPRT